MNSEVYVSFFPLIDHESLLLQVVLMCIYFPNPIQVSNQMSL